jgi:electron transfer flavoprotein beta subunit
MSDDIGPLTIIVCMKISPDTAQLRADPQTRVPRLDDVPRRIGIFDENALEEAVRLKERHGGKVLAISLAAIPPPPELIQRALAMGADEAYVIEESSVAQADSLATTRILAGAVERLPGWDLILCGEGSLDDYNRQVGPRLAEELKIPVLANVTQIDAQNGKMIVHRALEDRSLVIEASPPLLLTMGQEINEPRFPTVLQIMGASAKPVVHWTLGDVGFGNLDSVVSLSGVRTLSTLAPREERKQETIPGDDAGEMARELARRLFEDGLVRIE